MLITGFHPVYCKTTKDKTMCSFQLHEMYQISGICNLSTDMSSDDSIVKFLLSTYAYLTQCYTSDSCNCTKAVTGTLCSQL